MVLLVSAFIFGLLGSLHCLGMCAPIIWALPQDHSKRSVWLTKRVTYNLGRIITYALLGTIIGLVGESFALAGWQQYISIATGVMMLLFLLLSKGHIPQSFQLGWMNKFFLFVKTKLSGFMKGNTYKTNFLLGFYNGLLPCGLVYLALMASISMGTLEGGALYMAVFGLGTFPMMLGAAWVGGTLKNMRQGLYQKWVPRFVVLVALLLIIRGLNLGVPYLSPKLSNQNDITLCITP